MAMSEEARINAAGGSFRRAGAAGRKAQKAGSLGGLHRQNVMEIGLEFDLNKQLSKIKDEPTMLMKINDLKNDKMPDATMLMN
jgi:hypothetical protein